MITRGSPRDISRLPAAPDAPEYRKLLEYCSSRDVNPDDKAHLFRVSCESDFWMFCRYATSARFFICEYEDCRYRGRHMFDHPFLFERCRSIQADPDGFIDLWPRAHLKTTTITQYLTLWDFLHRPNATVAIVTWELEDVGKSFVDSLQAEMEPELVDITYRHTIDDRIQRSDQQQPRNAVLAYHWPEIFWQDPQSEARKWKRGELNLKKHPGTKENSISAMSLGAIRTSQHFHTIIYDDIVVERSSSSPDACADCTKKFGDTGALRHPSFPTRVRGVGTRWASGDTYRHILDEGILKRRVGPEDCYDDNGESIFHPGSKWLDAWRAALGQVLFQANMRNKPVDEQSTFHFRIEWISQPSSYYDCDPEEIAKDANLYFHVDPAKPKARGGSVGRTDFIGIVGFALRPDGRRYVIEMIRDKMSSERASEVIFGIDLHWRAQENPIRHWWWELRGGAWDMAFWEAEMKRKKHAFDLLEYKDTTNKDLRIAKLMVPFERTDIVLPARLYRETEGSMIDMVAEFRDREYLRWQPKAGGYWRPSLGARNDDLLDTMAQSESPEVRRLYEIPVDTSPGSWKGAQYREDLKRQRRNQKSQTGSLGRSPWSC